MNNMDNMEIIFDEFEQFCHCQNREKIEQYLKMHGWLVHYKNGTCFEIIADKGNLDLMKIFIKYGAKIDIDHSYVLYTCAYHNYDDCVEYLLKSGANINDIKHTCGYDNALKINNRA